jgi:hypothetical protein
MRKLAFTLTLTALASMPTLASAQLNGLSVGGGVGVTASARASGKAYHGAVSLPIRFMPHGVELRVEAMYQAGTASTSPFGCERVERFYCLGRTDQNRIAATAFFVRAPMPRFGSWRFYFDPIGAGLYYRHTRSSETQAPTGNCIIDDQIVSCPNNPDWATFNYRVSRVSIGVNSGFGFETEIAGIRAFAELRAHRLFERGESSAGAVPITFGVSF